ncbi:MAG: hypothetical protein PF572_06165 [Patescibacteria group bacterium]|jgi:uncharacterized C2H2 Zn-finger protein|nr:hypothetical protein [Patescibacteria group bacterium]
MICPKCKNEFKKAEHIVYKHGSKNFLKSTCPKCDYVLSDKKTMLGKVERLIALLVISPFIFFAFLLFSLTIKNSISLTYLNLLALTIFSIFLLFLIGEIRKKVQNRQTITQNKKELQ